MQIRSLRLHRQRGDGRLLGIVTINLDDYELVR